MKRGKCFLLPERNADCDECHDRACPVMTGFATYDMLVDDDDSDEDSDEDSQK